MDSIASITGFRFDYAILGMGGFDDDGAPMDFDLEKIAVRQAAISRSLSQGFWMKSQAPRRIASTARSKLLQAVITITGV